MLCPSHDQNSFPFHLLPVKSARSLAVVCVRLLSVLLCAGFSIPVQASTLGLSERPSNQTCFAPQRPLHDRPIRLQPVLSLSQQSFPVDMMQAPGDPSRWFVVERDGAVVSYTDGQTFSPAGTFIDISARVEREFEGEIGSETGLLGMVFHPDFASNGEAFLYYSAAGNPLLARVSRFTSSDGGRTLNPNSEEILIEIERDQQWHWGGKMLFGDDGYLYIAFGDGGSHHTSQDPDTLLGKMIRIDVDAAAAPYGVPPGNMFVSGAGRPEIWAMGFRNPWRWSFDRITGDLWLGDVGNNNYEEINRVTAGGNYGWSVREGRHCSDLVACSNEGFIDPVAEYDHFGFNAVIGGFVYRGAAIPGLYGVYVYADLSGSIYALYHDAAGNPAPKSVLESGEFVLSISAANDDELYVLAQGRIFKIVPTSSPPTDAFPQTLSATGCVQASDPTQPAQGLVPYDLNVPLWSDGAAKQRWFAIPDGTTIDVDIDGDWRFPIGAVLMKTFSLDDKRVETRLFVRHDDGEWGGYSYEWNDQQTDASLLPAAKTSSVAGQQWYFPSSDQCMQCHTAASGRSLGLETAQLNRAFTYPQTGIEANQLLTLEGIGMLSAALPDVPANLAALPPPEDESLSVEARARGYLHANCAICHRPGGPGPGPEDFRYSVPLSQLGAIGVVPTRGDLGVAGARLIAPGHPELSTLALRLHTLGPSRMPPLASSVVDPLGTDLVDRWIAALPTSVDPCGKPDFAPGGIEAAFLWKDCATQLWHFIASGSGHYLSVFNGELNSDRPIDVTGVRLEPDDIFELTDPNRLAFKLSTNVGIDGFDITPGDAGSLCLSLSSPWGVALLVGEDATPVNIPFDLETLGNCPGDPDPDGAPSYDPRLDRGVYVWRESDGSWRLRAMSGGVYALHSGTITADPPFADGQVQGVFLGADDILDTSDPARIVFDLNTVAWLDGVNFSLPAGARQVCLDIQEPQGSVLRVGASGVPLAYPVDLLTMTPCSTTPNPFGTPSFDVNRDRAAHLWRNPDGAWALRVTGGGSFTNYYGTIQVDQPFADDAVQGVFLNPSDVLDVVNPRSVSFSLNVVAWQDGIDFEVPANARQACLHIDGDAGLELRLGGGGVPVPVPFDLLTLTACTAAP